jgi:hypothetical protein
MEMLETAYVVTWRWSDGSGSGALAVFMDKRRAERLVEALRADCTSRDHNIEAVPFDSTLPVFGEGKAAGNA